MIFRIEDKYRKSAGIYIIRNFVDDRVYIGQTQRLYERYVEHVRELRGWDHYNTHLQNFVVKYGLDNLSFELLRIESDYSKLDYLEQNYLDTFSKVATFNIAKTAECPMRGRKHSDKSKKIISKKLKGRVFTEEHRMRLSTSAKKRVYSCEECTKRSLQRKGRKLSKKWRENIGKGQVGRPGTTNKAVLQFDKQGIFIKEYSSILKASKELQLHACNIGFVCRGRKGYASCGGFIWKYK